MGGMLVTLWDDAADLCCGKSGRPHETPLGMEAPKPRTLWKGGVNVDTEYSQERWGYPDPDFLPLRPMEVRVVWLNDGAVTGKLCADRGGGPDGWVETLIEGELVGVALEGVPQVIRFREAHHVTEGVSVATVPLREFIGKVHPRAGILSGTWRETARDHASQARGAFYLACAPEQ